MLSEIHPKLPMRNKLITRDYYSKFGFTEIGDPGFEPYLMMRKDGLEIHFFKFEQLNPDDNYGQVYIRTNDIKSLYKSIKNKAIEIHPNGDIDIKPWGQIEFSLLDPDKNLLTFGQKL